MALALSVFCLGQTESATLQFDPARTSIVFTLGDIMHTVHGGFTLKDGRVTFNSSTGEVGGEVVVAAASGRSGNGMRDRKMQKDVLESAKFPEIIFRPDRLDGKVDSQGTYTVKIHGIFTIHGADHEMTIPVQVEMAADHWTASAHFVVPYEKWGMKNPSTFILRVSESVEIEVKTAGVAARPQAPLQ